MFASILKQQQIINNNKQLITMPRHCIAAGCDSAGGKGCSLHKFPQDEANKKKCIKAVKQQRSNWNGSSPLSLLCSKHSADDCFVTQGVHFRDEMGMPTAKCLNLMRCQHYLPGPSISYSLATLAIQVYLSPLVGHCPRNDNKNR